MAITVLTVSQVNTYIKALINEIPQIRNVYISGEISNFKHYTSSNHMYFTLKDEKSQLKCVMFSSDNYKLKFTPENGLKVICFGQIDVYERDGVYQLYVRDMQPQGKGSLTLAFEQLKDKLSAEGLFDESHKKAIPEYPQRIGVVTSGFGAAVEDIKNVLARRYPLCEVVIVPTAVQGDAASPEIVRAIKLLDSLGDIDTIIVGRGGGSIEDLWAFNTEPVARAVYNCKTPIISAVGHETDYTICDFVSDLRAPTPSAAAELAVPDINGEMIKINETSAALERLVLANIEDRESKLESIKTASPLANIKSFFESLEGNINNSRDKLLLSFKGIVSQKENLLKGSAFALNALSPLAVLSRGYSITKKDSEVISSTDSVSAGDRVNIVFSDGSASAEITEVNKNE